MDLKTIISLLQAAGKKLDEGIKIREEEEWELDDAGNLVKKADHEFNDRNIDATIKGFENVINQMKTQANSPLKSKKDIQDLIDSIEKLQKDIKDKLGNEKVSKDSTATATAIKQKLDNFMKNDVKNIVDELTDKKKAIEQYVTSKYDINDHLKYEQDKIDEVKESKEKNLNRNEKIKEFEDEFGYIFEDYKFTNANLKQITNIQKLAKEMEKINKDLEAEKKKTSNQDQDKINKLETELNNKFAEYKKIKTSYEKGDELPDELSDVLKQTELDKIDKMVSDKNDELKIIDNNYKKIVEDRLSHVDRNTINASAFAFFKQFRLNPFDFVWKPAPKTIEEMMKVIENAKKEVKTRDEKYQSQIDAYQNTCDKINEYINAKTAKEDMEKTDINAKTTADFYNEGKTTIDNNVTNEMLNTYNLPAVSSGAKRKDIRRALISTTYKNKYENSKFFGKRWIETKVRFKTLFNKEKAFSEVKNHYKNMFTEAYKNAELAKADDIRKRYNIEEANRTAYAKKYEEKGQQMAINSNKSRDELREDVYEEMDR